MIKRAKLPSLVPVATGNTALDTLLRQMIERMEVREGSRGDAGERVVTQRDLQSLGLSPGTFLGQSASRGATGGGGVVVQTPSGTYSSVPYDTFSNELRNTGLYKDLMAGIDNVNRFDGIPQEVKELLLSSLADEAKARGAEIRRLDKAMQTATDSLAYTVEEVTASVQGVAAGVREVSFASANASTAVAGKVTAVTARLDDFSDGKSGTATIEEVMKATADRATGLEAQYTIKLKAGKAIAGFGLAATEDTAGATTSAFLVQADKFAIVSPYYNGSTTAPDIRSIPFGVNASTGQVYINGSLTINGAGDPIDTLIPATYKDYMFQRSTNATTGPTEPSGTATGNWMDTPQAGSGYLYMTSADRKVNGEAVVGAWSKAVRIDGYEGATTKYQYAVTNSASTAPGSYDGSPSPIALQTGQFLWMRSGVTVPPSTTPATWSAYVRISGEKGDTGLTGKDSVVPGKDGTRGTIVTKIDGAWNVYTANAKIAAVATSAGGTPTTPIKGDIVSHLGGAKEFDGSNWGNVAAYIDGSLIVTGTIGADKISAGTISAEVSINSKGYGVFSGSTATSVPTYATVQTTILGESIKTTAFLGTACGVVGKASVGGLGNISIGVAGVSTSTGGASAGIYGYGPVGGYFDGTSYAIWAVQNVNFENNLTVGGYINAKYDITAYGTSDMRLKKNISRIKKPLEKLAQLRGVMFDWRAKFIKAHGGEDGYFVRKHDVGVIAQEVQAVMPEIVALRKDGTLAVKYDKLTPLLIEAVNALAEKVARLERK